MQTNTEAGGGKQRFLVSLPRGEFVNVRARSREELERALPDVDIVDPEPDWFTDEHRRQMSTGHEFDIDSPLDIKMLTTEPEIVFDRRSGRPRTS